MIFATWGGNSVGNAYADLLLGNAQQYIESNKDVLIIMAYNTFDGYATDSWKVSKRLTLDYGMRFSHLGPWVDSNNTGLAIFDPSKAHPTAITLALPQTSLTGIEWNKKVDSAVPLSGTSLHARSTMNPGSVSHGTSLAPARPLCAAVTVCIASTMSRTCRPVR